MTIGVDGGGGGSREEGGVGNSNDPIYAGRSVEDSVKETGRGGSRSDSLEIQAPGIRSRQVLSPDAMTRSQGQIQSERKG
jgi:hypothetical protein